MENVIKTWKHAMMMVAMAFISAVVMAQDSTSTSTSISTSTTRTETTWYSAPWVWIVGAAVFILLLVALIGGSKKSSSTNSDRVTVTKTVRRDTDTA